ncbi:MAG: AAA family ATPase [Chlorobi bacterium]|nr:AAA family ATPase [Chlorobiota bacterium]
MLIIGITGTLGAGKGTIVDYLVRKKGFAHFSVRQYLINVMKQKGLEVNRDNMVVTANELRAKHSPSFIIEELYANALKQKKNAVIESIRTPGEIDFLKKQGNFLLLAVDADPGIRYERIKLRQSDTDHIDFKTFLENEQREMTATDPNNQNLRACIERADIKLINNGTREELYRQLEEKLKL